MAKSNQKDSVESVEDILSEIKNVISGDSIEVKEPMNQDAEEDDDVMELTEIVELEDELDIQFEEEVADTSENDNVDIEAIEDDEDEEFIDVLQEIDDSIKDADNIKAEKLEKVELDNMAVEDNKNVEEEALDLDSMLELEDESEEANTETDDDVMELDAMMEEIVAEDGASEVMEDEALELSSEADASSEDVLMPSEDEDPAKVLEDIKNSIEGKEPLVQFDDEEVSQAESPSEDDKNIISPENAAKSSSAIKHLMESIPKTKIDSPEFRSGTSLEDVVREAISPMLKEWLDANLEIIVKDIVQKEIKKILPDD